MKGAIIGDVVGSIYEFNNTQNPAFPLLSDDSTFTDDTICTIAIAEALINNKSYSQALKEWCRKYPNPMGSYGSRFYSWIYNDDHDYSNDSCGNGALMRISPLCLADIPTVTSIIEVGKATSCSHNNAEALRATLTLLRIIRRLLKYKDKKVVSSTMRDSYHRLWRHCLPNTGVFTDTCEDTLKLAAHLFLESESFEDAIRLAVVYGGDSDTLADIVGSMAEAYYGVDDNIWKEVEKRLPQEFITIINKFYDTCAG